MGGEIGLNALRAEATILHRRRVCGGQGLGIRIKVVTSTGKAMRLPCLAIYER